MAKHFYSHITDIDELLKELDKVDLSEEERVHLTAVVHSSVHTVVLDVVMSELAEHDKKQFLHHVHTSEHKIIWKFLNARTRDVESKIQKAVEELKKEFLKDIKGLKK